MNTIKLIKKRKLCKRKKNGRKLYFKDHTQDEYRNSFKKRDV